MNFIKYLTSKKNLSILSFFILYVILVILLFPYADIHNPIPIFKETIVNIFNFIHPMFLLAYLIISFVFWLINYKNKQQLNCDIIFAVSAFFLILILGTISTIDHPEDIPFYYVISYLALISIFSFITFSKQSAQAFFLSLAIPLGLIYGLAILPWSVPDATTHTAAVYRFSNLLLGDDAWATRTNDADFFKKIWIKHNWSTSFRPTKKDYLNLIDYTLQNKTENFDFIESPIKNPIIECYSITSYFPLVLGMTISRLAQFDTIPLIYTAKIFLFIIYLLTLYFAIKNIPVGKYALAMIASFPAPLMFASGFSYDGMVLITTFSFIAGILSLQQEYTIKKLINCLFWIFLVASVKGGGYILLLPIVFIIPKPYRLKSSLMIFATAVLSITFFNLLLLYHKEMFQFHNADENHLYAAFAIEQPLSYLKMMSAAYYHYTFFLFEHMLGTNIIWPQNTDSFFVFDHMLKSGTPWVQELPNYLLIFLFFMALASGYLEKQNISSFTAKIFTLIIGVAILALPIMLLSFTTKDSSVILGLQGRYYLPFLPLFVLICQYFLNKLKRFLQFDLNKSLFLTIFASLSFTATFSMIYAYWR